MMADGGGSQLQSHIFLVNCRSASGELLLPVCGLGFEGRQTELFCHWQRGAWASACKPILWQLTPAHTHSPPSAPILPAGQRAITPGGSLLLLFLVPGTMASSNHPPAHPMLALVHSPAIARPSFDLLWPSFYAPECNTWPQVSNKQARLLGKSHYQTYLHWISKPPTSAIVTSANCSDTHLRSSHASGAAPGSGQAGARRQARRNDRSCWLSQGAGRGEG